MKSETVQLTSDVFARISTNKHGNVDEVFVIDEIADQTLVHLEQLDSGEFELRLHGKTDADTAWVQNIELAFKIESNQGIRIRQTN